jgi:hypothetical protein
MDARPKILASKLYPLKSIRADQMADALRALSSAELVTLYEVGGKPFLQMKTWERHQQIRAKRSKYPEPENSNLISSDINCNQMISDDCKCHRNPIQSESEYENPNTNPKSNPNTNSSSAGDFEEFWAAYPRKVGKSDAQKAFAKVKVPVQVLIEAINKQKTTEQWCKDGGKYIPYPATWLNGSRWQDEVEEYVVGECAVDDGVVDDDDIADRFVSEEQEDKLVCWEGSLGKGVVYLTERQFESLMDKLGLDAFERYVPKLADFIINKKANVKNHYETILKWYEEDTQV